MKKLTANLLSIYGSLKNLHYCVDGPNYYQMHLLADRLINDIDPLGVIDHINEHLIGIGDKFIPFQESMDKESVAQINPRATIEETKLLLQKTARMIEGMDCEDRGLEAYLTAVEDTLISSVGFLDKITKKGTC